MFWEYHGLLLSLQIVPLGNSKSIQNPREESDLEADENLAGLHASQAEFVRRYLVGEIVRIVWYLWQYNDHFAVYWISTVMEIALGLERLLARSTCAARVSLVGKQRIVWEFPSISILSPWQPLIQAMAPVVLPPSISNMDLLKLFLEEWDHHFWRIPIIITLPSVRLWTMSVSTLPKRITRRPLLIPLRWPPIYFRKWQLIRCVFLFDKKKYRWSHLKPPFGGMTEAIWSFSIFVWVAVSFGSCFRMPMVSNISSFPY